MSGEAKHVVALVVGVRPHFIKAAAVLRLLDPVIRSVLIHTGQHYDPRLSSSIMTSVGLREPDRRMHIGSGTSPGQVGQGIMQLEPILTEIQPAMTVVIGDANSSLIGALASAQVGVPVCHVEACVSKPLGPWIAEEVNRRLIDSVSTLGLAPTRSKAATGRRACRLDRYRRVRFAGDLLLDQMVATTQVDEAHDLTAWAAAQRTSRRVLVTLHRPETLRSVDALERVIVTVERRGWTAEFCIHPRTNQALQALGLLDRLRQADRCILHGPLDHRRMAEAMARAEVVITDSSGIQREAYFLGVPCCVARDATEYDETLGERSGVLADPQVDDIDDVVSALAGGEFAPDYEQFGGGTAAARIVRRLRQELRAPAIAVGQLNAAPGAASHEEQDKVIA